MSAPIVGIARMRSAFDELESYLAGWKEPQPAFDFSLGWADDYDSLFQDRVVVTGIEEILQRVSKTGRVLISGRGGAAKTTILYRLARGLLGDQTVFPIIVNLKSWNAPLYEEWKAAPDDVSYRMEFLLTRVGIPKLNLATLDAVDPQVMRLLLVDGLNEITPATAQEMILTFDEYVRRAPQSGVVITDRIVRRRFTSTKRWNLCTVLPVSDENIRKYLQSNAAKLTAFEKAPPAEQALLRTPLFLDQFLHSSRSTASGLLTNAAELEYYFVGQIGLTAKELRSAAVAAYVAYEKQATRTFPLLEFEKNSGRDITERLKAAGAIQVKGDLGFFTHHLHHDFLVSLLLAETEDRWRPEHFNVVTFKAASFDILALTLEQLKETRHVDLFLQRLYDWNVYAPAYALAEAYHGGGVLVSMEVEVIMLAMLAERKWDRVKSTAQKAADGLALFPRKTRADAFLQVKTLSELFELVWSFNSESKTFNEWRKLFAVPRDKSLSDAAIEKLLEADSITGWTLANVLKRISVSESQIKLFRRWARESAKSETIVWRLAHVLGAYPSKGNIDTLFEIFERQDVPWASYGALRSLIEMASRSKDAELTLAIFQRLGMKLDRLLTPALIREFEHLLFVDPAPEIWAKAVLDLLERIYARQHDDGEGTHWMTVAQQFAKAYSFELKANS
jgi:hypothetical protein